MRKYTLLLILVLSFFVFSCSLNPSMKALSLTDDIEKSTINLIDISGLNNQASNYKDQINSFSLNLLKETFENENILISPLSIVSSLGMVTNGAKDRTLIEIEKVLNSDIQGLNDYLLAYVKNLPIDRKYKVNIANSIWFKEKTSLSVDKSFLQTSKDYYNASIYKAAFDTSTKNDINAWVRLKTNGMIERVLEEAPPADAIMYLINALSFEAEWDNIYHKADVTKECFKLENMEVQEVDFMYSEEDIYLEGDYFTGFIKPYKDNKYGFVALLPKEGFLMSEVLDVVNEAMLSDLLAKKNNVEVRVQIPKFTVASDISLNQSLKNLGMPTAFDSKLADFSGLANSAEGNIYINKVLHKTKITVDEKGTKAGAITAIEVSDTSVSEDPKEVILNRPFLYLIIDTEQNLPLFMGTLMSAD